MEAKGKGRSEGKWVGERGRMRKRRRLRSLEERFSGAGGLHCEIWGLGVIGVITSRFYAYRGMPGLRNVITKNSVKIVRRLPQLGKNSNKETKQRQLYSLIVTLWWWLVVAQES